MGANRPKSIKNKAYVEIDYDYYKATGELVPKSQVIVAPEITVKVPRGKFEIVYTAELLGILEKLGGKRIQVFSYLLDHKDSNNCINTSQRELAKATKTSIQTVNSTIKTLSEYDLVKRKGTVYMLSPNLMIKGNQIREAYLMRKYVEEMKVSVPEDDNQVIDTVADTQLHFNEEGDIYESYSPEIS